MKRKGKRRGRGRRVARKSPRVVAVKVKRRASRRRRRRASSGAPLVVLGQGSFRRTIRGKGGRMAKRGKRRGARRRFSRGGGGGGGGGMLGGFVSKDTLAAIGGAAGAAFFGPIIGRLIPAGLVSNPVGGIIGGVLVGGVGYLALRRVSKTAALTFAAASIAPALVGMIGQRVAGVSGMGEYYGADGVNYLPDVDGVSGMDDGDDMEGLGEYDADALEVE